MGSVHPNPVPFLLVGRTPARNGYNALDVNLKCYLFFFTAARVLRRCAAGRGQGCAKAHHLSSGEADGNKGKDYWH